MPGFSVLSPTSQGLPLPFANLWGPCLRAKAGQHHPVRSPSWEGAQGRLRCVGTGGLPVSGGASALDASMNQGAVEEGGWMGAALEGPSHRGLCSLLRVMGFSQRRAAAEKEPQGQERASLQQRRAPGCRGRGCGLCRVLRNRN